MIVYLNLSLGILSLNFYEIAFSVCMSHTIRGECHRLNEAFATENRETVSAIIAP
jgi:hypothetical protein